MNTSVLGEHSSNLHGEQVRSTSKDQLLSCSPSIPRSLDDPAHPSSTKAAGVIFRRVHLDDICQSAWRSLLLESGSRNVYYDRSFLDAAAQAWPERRPTAAIVGYRGERLVFLQPYRVTKNFLGTTVYLADIPTADHIEPIVAPDGRAEIIREFRKYLIESLKPDLVVGSSLTRDFACQLADGFGISAVRSGANRHGWFLDLPQSLDGFWKQYRSNFRSQLRRKIRKAGSAGLEFRIVTEGALPAGYDLQSALDNLLRLHKLRFDSLNRRSFFLKPEFLSFHKHICQRATNQSMSISFTEAIHHGQVVGSMYGIRAPHAYVFLMTGFDPRFAKLSPGSLLLFHTIRDLIGRNVKLFDFKCGDEAYKRRWANGRYDNFDLEVVLTARGRISQLGRSVANMIRSFRNNFAAKLSAAVDRYPSPAPSSLPQLTVMGAGQPHVDSA